MKKLVILCMSFCMLFLFACKKQTTVDDVVNMVVEAYGGAETLNSITDQVTTWDFTMAAMPMPEKGETQEGEEAGEGKEMPEGQKMMMPMTITVKRPNKIRFDMMNQEGAVYMTSCFDGTKGWSMQMGQQQEMMEEMAHDYEVMAMGWIDGFLNYQEKGFTLELLPDETIDDVTYLVLQSTDQYGNVTKNYIHPETHYIERAAGEMLNMQGQREPMYMTMTDYKMIEGCAMAQTVAQYKENGEMIWESKLTDAKFNTGVEDDQFKPQAMTMK